MQSTSRNLIDVLKISVIALALTVGVNYLIAWTGAPAGGAPTCPSTHVGCNPPIHSGTADQTKTGGLTVNNLWGSFVGSTGGAWFGTKVGIGPGASATGTAALDVDGTIRVRGGSPTAGAVLAATDSSGNAEWSTSAGGASASAQFCNTTDTGVDANASGQTGGGLGPDGGYGWFYLDLMKNGRNICEDSNGCTYRIWKYTSANPAGLRFYGTNPVVFRQFAPSHQWHDAAGDNRGTNGDGVYTKFVDWEMVEMYDDYVQSTGVNENTSSRLVIQDLNFNGSYYVTVCDY